MYEVSKFYLLKIVQLTEKRLLYMFTFNKVKNIIRKQKTS